MRNFIVLVQTKSIARAAEKIHMTASPFGKSIIALEAQVGYPLFTRKDNSICLNKAGQELYQKLFPVYERLSAIENELHNSTQRSQKVVLGIDNTYPTIIFDQLISLGDKYENVSTQAVEFSENGVIDDLLGHQLDSGNAFAATAIRAVVPAAVYPDSVARQENRVAEVEAQ